MTESSGIGGQLAGLTDGELVAVLLAATAGRPTFAPVRTALLGLAEVGDAVPGDIVTPDTNPVVREVPPPSTAVSGQVDAATPVPGSLSDGAVPTDFSPSGVPTFESVRDKVGQRFGTAQGMDELDRQTRAGRSVDEQWEAREQAARERLDRIRKSLRDDESGDHRR
ncbi:PspA/IM30 family protein [Nocardia callitridis]|uniref:Uncharacterized protein n=1 Tax=Nocardia callitridis TaxID=648753 RepID=A0ABP9KM14_9NOCA